MRIPRITHLAGVVLFCNAFAVNCVWADALMRSQAMKAATIAQYYVTEEAVTLELEIGLSDLETFRNLLPDSIYVRLTSEERPLRERLEEFFTEDLYVVADGGEPIRGRVLAMERRTRLRRDEITGEPLPSSDTDPEPVLYARILFPFSGPPQTLTFGKRRTSNIGFVLYHKGIAVNDFRFLAPMQNLKLDWADPWYSAFDTRTLRRTYFAPMSGFLYVEPYEVRKEIIVRPKDLQQWLDLGLAGRDSIPVDMQEELKRQVAGFLRDRQKVLIDGEAITPELARINFLERTLTASRVIDPPEELDINAATLGVIFVYPTVVPLPQKVTLDWDMFTEKMPLVPAAAVDQAGPMPTLLEPGFAVLEWQNFLRFPELPELKAVIQPPSDLQNLAYYARWVILVAGVLMIWRIWQARQPGLRPNAVRILTALTLVAATTAVFWLGEGARLAQPAARSVVADLLHNVYRAFDFRAEEDIYDVLDKSVSGDLLTQIYLETRRGLVLENQGGARAKVKEIEVVDMTASGGEDGGFLADVTWVVGGSVGHWGHLHQRRNKYQAELDIRPVNGVWKLVGMVVLQEERL
jgi:hypothetical protein